MVGVRHAALAFERPRKDMTKRLRNLDRVDEWRDKEKLHIKAPSKRSWAQCKAASSSPMSMPDDRKHASD